jgi:hypothetical protein
MCLVKSPVNLKKPFAICGYRSQVPVGVDDPELSERIRVFHKVEWRVRAEANVGVTF